MKQANELIIKIEGMRCGGCSKRVENALSALKEVKNVKVSLEEKQAIVILKKEIDPNVIKETIDNLGFNVTEIK